MGDATRCCPGDGLPHFKLIVGQSDALQLSAALLCCPLDAHAGQIFSKVGKHLWTYTLFSVLHESGKQVMVSSYMHADEEENEVTRAVLTPPNMTSGRFPLFTKTTVRAATFFTKKVIMAFPSPHSSRHQNTHVSSPHTSSEQLLSSPNWSSEEPLLTKNGHQSSWVTLKYQLRSNNPCKLTRDALIIDLRDSCRIIKKSDYLSSTQLRCHRVLQTKKSVIITKNEASWHCILDNADLHKSLLSVMFMLFNLFS